MTEGNHSVGTPTIPDRGPIPWITEALNVQVPGLGIDPESVSEVRLRGGCGTCDADTVVPVAYVDGAFTIPSTGRVSVIQVEHDDWCPVLAQANGGAR
ncbi:hypothetical protein [Gordonia sp. NPDC003950]